MENVRRKRREKKEFEKIDLFVDENNQL